MGDRGNIHFIDGRAGDGSPQGIWMYTHWRGSDLPAVVHASMAQHQRWDDPPYLARILFQGLLGKDAGTTGFGLSTGVGDGERKVVEVDADAQRISFPGRERSWTFEEYVRETPEALLAAFHGNREG